MLDRNVRRIGIALCLLTLFIFLSGCGSLKDDTLLTVNAVITEVDAAKQTITVKDDADENTLQLYWLMSGILPCCLEAGGLLLLLRVCRRASHKKSG